MSGTVSIPGVAPDPTIYGTLADAISYITARFGVAYKTWIEDVEEDDQKRTLVSARDFLDQQLWIADYDTFDKRDALDAFKFASYELAVLVADDESVLSELDAGSNIKSASAGGAGVEFFNPSSATSATATLLPPVLQRLIGSYLGGGAADAGAGSSYGSSGGCAGEFAARDRFKRWDPY